MPNAPHLIKALVYQGCFLELNFQFCGYINSIMLKSKGFSRLSGGSTTFGRYLTPLPAPGRDIV